VEVGRQVVVLMFGSRFITLVGVGMLVVFGIKARGRVVIAHFCPPPPDGRSEHPS
jgi:hypothetical protein